MESIVPWMCIVDNKARIERLSLTVVSFSDQMFLCQFFKRMIEGDTG